MRLKLQQFLFKRSHSWAVVGQNLAREFIKLGHEVDLICTQLPTYKSIDEYNNDKYCPEDLKPFIKLKPKPPYDFQFSYTAPHNWSNYLNKAFGGKSIATWNYEYNGKKILPQFTKYHKCVDFVAPSSEFSKDIFINMGVPKDKLVVIPHGINLDNFKSNNDFISDKKVILLNIAQPHIRKNIPAALESFGKAFTKNDNVKLIAKVLVSNKKDQLFDVDFFGMLKTFKTRYPNHAEIEVKTDFIKNIADIYNECHINFSATFAEAFFLPGIEAMAAGKINVVPNYGGLLDFCNENNSLLIDGEIVKAPRKAQYWTYNPYAVHFKINTDHAAEQLKKAVEHYDELLKQFLPNMRTTVEKFTWENAAKQIIDLAKEK